jgi:hypothetical protein
MNQRGLSPDIMIIDRDPRTVEGRCETTAAAGGDLRPQRPRLAAAGPAAPPPLEAAWLESVGCVTLRRDRGEAEGMDVFPDNGQD